jgi:Tol biopolymer transport system component
LKKHQIALLVLLSVAAAITVACGNSSNPVYSNMPFNSDRAVTPATALFTMSVNGSSATPVQTGSSNSLWGLSVSADFKTVTYVTGGEVWSVTPAGGTPTQLTQNAANNTYSNLSRISPNGQKIVYPVFSTSVGSGSIWIMNADGSGSTNLTPTLPTGMAVCYVASFSADSSMVVFACEGSSGFGLFTAKNDGTQLATVLTQSTPIDSPAFTANGKQILYVTYGTPGADAKLAGHHTAFAEKIPHLQPEGTPQPPSNSGVASVNLDGSSPTLMVPATTEQIWESEVLNSSLYYVMYDSNVGFYQIFKANLDGSGSASISDGTADDQLGVCGGC